MAKGSKNANLAYRNVKFWAIEKIIGWLIEKREKMRREIESIDTKKHFERKFTEEEIRRMMLTLPESVKKNPTVNAIQSVYPNISRRQVIKVKEHAEYAKNFVNS